MLQTLTPEIEEQLSEIGFDEDEIVIINYIHQFKGKELLGYLQESVRTYCFQRYDGRGDQNMAAKTVVRRTGF